MKAENWRVRLAVPGVISSLAGHGMDLLQSSPPTEPSSDDIRAKIIESTAFSEIIALMKDENSWVRGAATNAITSLAGRSMNLLQTTITD
jgi:hypothetical protein